MPDAPAAHPALTLGDFLGSRCGHNFPPEECPYPVCGYRDALREMAASAALKGQLQESKDALMARQAEDGVLIAKLQAQVCGLREQATKLLDCLCTEMGTGITQAMAKLRAALFASTPCQHESAVVALSEQLEADRTAVADGVTAANKAIDSRHWLTEGRGSYEWNDDRWHDEFRAAALEIKAALEPLAKIAANWKDCPQTSVEVAQARIDLKAQVATLQAQITARIAHEHALFKTSEEWKRQAETATAEVERLRIQAGKLPSYPRLPYAKPHGLGPAFAWGFESGFRGWSGEKGGQAYTSDRHRKAFLDGYTAGQEGLAARLRAAREGRQA